MKIRGAYALIVITLVVVLGLGSWNYAAATMDPVESAEQQLTQLLNIGNHVTEGPVEVTIKWQGEWSTLLSPQEAADVLSTSLGLSKAQKNKFQNHDQYIAVAERDGAQYKLVVTVQKKGQYYVILSTKADIARGLDDLNEIQYNQGNSLLGEGVYVTWSAALQGKIIGDSDVNSLTTSEQLRQLERKLPTIVGDLQVVETYEDINTVSHTYEVSEFPIAVASGGHAVSMQIALHNDSNTGVKEISIGSPLLTIE